MTSIDIGNGVTSIGEGLFYNWSNVTSISLPDTLEKIKTDALYGTSITSIDIPETSTVISIATGTAQALPRSLTEITCDSRYMYILQGGAYVHTLFPSLSVIHCIDGRDACEEGISNPTDILIDTATKKIKNLDGSYTLQTYDGTFIGYKGKRIYTIEEAERVSKQTGNKIGLKYK